MTRTPLARRAFTLTAALALLAGGHLAAQEAAPRAGGEGGGRIGWHAVRPGDTLEGLSRHHSGSAELWRENWRLNPQIKDPDLLLPGQRIRLLLAAAAPPDIARVAQVARQVEEKPNPYPWEATNVDHLLQEGDGVRTYPRSSVELVFADDAALRVTEDSLIFLHRVGQRLRGVARDEVEIVTGQADLDVRRQARGAAGIDIVLGEARATPRPAEEGVVQARARRPEAGGAQLMVYTGASAMEAAGDRVEVGQGMGTTVAEGAAPSPPEKLLEPPQLADAEPSPGTGWSRPLLTWQAVDGARDYTVEVCRDPECGALVERVVELSGPPWQPGTLAAGSYYWRATAVAASGLDGYPSPAASFTVPAGPADLEPPTASLSPAGRYLRCGGELMLGPEASLVVAGEDADSGIAAWTYHLDGEEVDAEAFAGPWTAGRHTAEAVVRDRAGNRSTLGPLAFLNDLEPPRLDWQAGGAELVRRHGLPNFKGGGDGWRSRRRLARRGVALEWSADGGHWLPLSWPGRGPAVARAAASVGRTPQGVATADHPQIFLRAPVADPFAPAAPVSLGRGRILRLTADDTACGVDRLTFGIAPGATGPVLWIEATDLVGNRASVEWPLEEGRRRR